MTLVIAQLVLSLLFEQMIMSDDVSQRKDNWIRVESRYWLFGQGVCHAISEYVENSTDQFVIFWDIR